MVPLVGEATAGLATFDPVGLDWRDMLAAEKLENILSMIKFIKYFTAIVLTSLLSYKS